MANEDFKRPDHPDFMDYWELKKAEWSGIRSNKIAQEVEIWIAGEIKERVTLKDMQLNPKAFTRAYERVFGFFPDTVTTEKANNYAKP